MFEWDGRVGVQLLQLVCDSKRLCAIKYVMRDAMCNEYVMAHENNMEARMHHASMPVPAWCAHAGAHTVAPIRLLCMHALGQHMPTPTFSSSAALVTSTLGCSSCLARLRAGVTCFAVAVTGMLTSELTAAIAPASLELPFGVGMIARFVRTVDASAC